MSAPEVHVRRVRRFVDHVGPWLRRAISPVCALEVRGVENVPERGPVLLVANHSSMFDPLTLILASGRGLQWVATETAFEPLIAGTFYRTFGCIPKRRFRRDLAAMRQVKAWAAAGAFIGVFPEGERTWDGRPLPLQPGVAGLARMTGASIVAARVENAYAHWPRWAPRPRRGRVAITFLPPRPVAPGEDLAPVEQALAADLAVPPRSREDLPLIGRDLAVGLENVLFACPECHAEGTRSVGDVLRCCTCAWSAPVDVQGRVGGVGLEVLAEALKSRTLAGLSSAATGAVLVEEGVVLRDAGGVVASGRLELHRDHLALGAWRLPLADVSNANVEYQRMLELHAGDRTWRCVIPKGSAWRWPWAIAHLRDQRA